MAKVLSQHIILAPRPEDELRFVLYENPNGSRLVIIGIGQNVVALNSPSELSKLGQWCLRSVDELARGREQRH